jgi:ankyrin repeat protein
MFIKNQLDFNIEYDDRPIIYDAINAALDYNYISIIKLLLDNNKIDVNKKNKYEKTVLFYVIENSNSEKHEISIKIIKLLLKAGADPNLNSGNINLLIYCVRKQFTDIVELLLIMKANINIQENITKNTPIHYAIKNKNRQLLELLLEFNPDLTIKDKNNKTPLELATDMNELFSIILLESYLKK